MLLGISILFIDLYRVDKFVNLPTILFWDVFTGVVLLSLLGSSVFQRIFLFISFAAHDSHQCSSPDLV